MVRGARTQARDVRTNTLVRVPSAKLGVNGVPVAGRGAILEIDGRGQAMRIE